MYFKFFHCAKIRNRSENSNAKDASRVTLELIEYVSTMNGSSYFSTISDSCVSSFSSDLCKGMSLS